MRAIDADHLKDRLTWLAGEDLDFTFGLFDVRFWISTEPDFMKIPKWRKTRTWLVIKSIYLAGLMMVIYIILVKYNLDFAEGAFNALTTVISAFAIIQALEKECKH